MSMLDAARRDVKASGVIRKDRLHNSIGYDLKYMSCLDSGIMSEHPLDGSKGTLEELKGREGPSCSAQMVPDWENSTVPSGACNEHDDVIGVVPVTQDVQTSPTDREAPSVPSSVGDAASSPWSRLQPKATLGYHGGSTRSAFRTHVSRKEMDLDFGGTNTSLSEAERFASSARNNCTSPTIRSAKAAWMSRYRDECVSKQQTVEEVHAPERSLEQVVDPHSSPLATTSPRQVAGAESERLKSRRLSPSMEWAKKSVRDTMLQQQQQFSEQVKELHRMFRVQRSLEAANSSATLKASLDKGAIANGCRNSDRPLGGQESAPSMEGRALSANNPKAFQNARDDVHVHSRQDMEPGEVVADRNERHNYTSSTSEDNEMRRDKSGRTVESWRGSDRRESAVTGSGGVYGHEQHALSGTGGGNRGAREEGNLLETVPKRRGKDVLMGETDFCLKGHPGSAPESGLFRRRGHEDEVLQAPDRLRGGHSAFYPRVSKMPAERAEGWGEVVLGKEKRKREVGGMPGSCQMEAEGSAEAKREKRVREETRLPKPERSVLPPFEVCRAKTRDSRVEFSAPLPVVSKPRRFAKVDITTGGGGVFQVAEDSLDRARPLNTAHGRNGGEGAQAGKESGMRGNFLVGGVGERAAWAGEHASEAEKPSAPRCEGTGQIPAQVRPPGMGLRMPGSGSMMGGFPMGENMQCGYGPGYEMQPGYGVGMGMMIGPGFGGGSMLMPPGMMGGHPGSMNMPPHPHFVGSGMDASMMWYSSSGAAGYPLSFQQCMQQYPSLQGSGQGGNSSWPGSMLGCMVGGGLYQGPAVGLGSQPQNQHYPSPVGGQGGGSVQQPEEPSAAACEDSAVKLGRHRNDEGSGSGAQASGWSSRVGTSGAAGGGSHGPKAGGSTQPPSFPPASIIPPPRPPFKRPPPLVLLRDGTTMHLKPLPEEKDNEKGRKASVHVSQGRNRSASDDDEKDREDLAGRSAGKALKGAHWIARHREATCTSSAVGGPASSSSGGGRVASRSQHIGERSRAGMGGSSGWSMAHRTAVSGAAQGEGEGRETPDAGEGVVGETGDEERGNDSVSSDNGAVFHPSARHQNGYECQLAEVGRGEESDSKSTGSLGRGSGGGPGFLGFEYPVIERNTKGKQNGLLPMMGTGQQDGPATVNPGQECMSQHQQQFHKELAMYPHFKDVKAEDEERQARSPQEGRAVGGCLQDEVKGCTQGRSRSRPSNPGCRDESGGQDTNNAKAQEGSSPTATGHGTVERKDMVVEGSGARSGTDNVEPPSDKAGAAVAKVGESRKRSSLEFLESAVLMLEEAEGRGEWSSHGGRGCHDKEAPKQDDSRSLKKGRGSEGRQSDAPGSRRQSPDQQPRSLSPVSDASTEAGPSTWNSHIGSPETPAVY